MDEAVDLAYRLYPNYIVKRRDGYAVDVDGAIHWTHERASATVFNMVEAHFVAARHNGETVEV